jgi:hypothetical protein
MKGGTRAVMIKKYSSYRTRASDGSALAHLEGSLGESALISTGEKFERVSRERESSQ